MAQINIPIKLIHSNHEHNNWFVVNWCLGNTCNFKCSYCPSGLHDGSKRWPELETIKKFIVKLKQQHKDKNLYFEFTGGEVTLYKSFTELCKFCNEQEIKIGIITNGSRTIRFWEEHKEYLDHVCISFHPEFSNVDHFLNVIELLHDSSRVHVNVMMSPEKFDLCYSVADRVKNIDNISMALQPLIVDFGDTLYNYTEQQLDVFNRQHELFSKKIKFTKRMQYYRGAMKEFYQDGTSIVKSAHKFIADKTNDWSGWKCYAGVEQLIVDMDGRIYRGWCKVGGAIGHIDDDRLLPVEPIVCNKTMCHCNFDIMSTKEKN